MRRSWIFVLILTATFTACRQPATLEPKTRPSRVPSNAVWAGGADGGAYVRCSVDAVRNVNPCTVWNDNTGESVSGDYRLTKENRAASESELTITGAVNEFIFLENGKLLKRQGEGRR